jgi:hypothetical protein
LTGGVTFHGAHVLAAVLKDLSTRFELAKADEVVLVGSGSGADGVVRNCDLLADSLAAAAADGRKPPTVKCVADGGGLVAPHWVTDCSARRAARAESMDALVGRRSDESCLAANNAKMNSSALALECGDFSRFTLLFFIILN